MKIGRSGTTDKFILYLRPGFYLSIRVWKRRIRVALGCPYKPTFTWIRG